MHESESDRQQRAPAPRIEPDGQGRPSESSRRHWLELLGAAVGLSVLGIQLSKFFRHRDHETSEGTDSPREQFLVCKEDELGPDQMRLVGSGAKRFIVYRVGNEPPRARSAVCTHMGCTVQYRPDRHALVCPCHRAVYDAVTGRVLSGPAPRPLAAYRVEKRDGMLYVLTSHGV